MCVGFHLFTYISSLRLFFFLSSSFDLSLNWIFQVWQITSKHERVHDPSLSALFRLNNNLFFCSFFFFVGRNIHISVFRKECNFVTFNYVVIVVEETSAIRRRRRRKYENKSELWGIFSKFRSKRKMVEPFHGILCSIFVILLITLHSVDVANGSVSGVYVDNGDQTVMHHALTADDTEEVEREILELLGLPDRPRKKHVHPSLRYYKSFDQQSSQPIAFCTRNANYNNCTKTPYCLRTCRPLRSWFCNQNQHKLS